MNPNRKPISVKIQASDVEKFGVPKEWVGQEIEMFATAWSKYTGKAAGSINTSVFADKNNVKKGNSPRDTRQIVGFEATVRLEPAVKKVKSKDDKALGLAMAAFLYKKPVIGCVSG